MSESISLDVPNDGKAHVFIFLNSEDGKKKRFARIDDLSTTYPHDQVDAALWEVGFRRADQV